jgi:hypothetical protein
MNGKFNESKDLPQDGFAVAPIRCEFMYCARSAVLRLDRRFFCLEHLVKHCHQRLAACQRESCRNLVPANEATVSNDCFLEECTSTVAGFLMGRPELENIDRARLLDVLLWAAELDSKYGRPAPHCRVVAKGAGGS